MERREAIRNGRCVSLKWSNYSSRRKTPSPRWSHYVIGPSAEVRLVRWPTYLITMRSGNVLANKASKLHLLATYDFERIVDNEPPPDSFPPPSNVEPQRDSGDNSSSPILEHVAPEIHFPTAAMVSALTVLSVGLKKFHLKRFCGRSRILLVGFAPAHRRISDTRI